MTAQPATGAKPPERIGPYRILETLGGGGMGTVYLAEQKEPVRRRVALKVIKLGMDSKAVLVRFEAERRALAMMEHSCIATVFDAGVTEQGAAVLARQPDERAAVGDQQRFSHPSARPPTDRLPG